MSHQGSSKSLTPSKLCLLQLVLFYCRNYIPPDGKIPILSYLAAQLLPLRRADNLSAAPGGALINSRIDDFCVLLSPYKAPPSDSKNLWEHFIASLWHVRDIDHFFTWVNNFNKLLVDQALSEHIDVHEARPKHVVLSRNSLLGVFVRRAVLEFEQLQFHDVATLWQDFDTYRAVTADCHRPELSMFSDSVVRAANNDFHNIADERILAIIGQSYNNADDHFSTSSTKDTERLLEFQIDEMQKHGSRIPSDVRDFLESALDSTAKTSTLMHYIRFLDAWYAGDYSSSFDYLHQYYDYAMHHKDRSHYQYALLNTAILQADFGCYGEAIDAMQETIAAARENKDMGCLNFSLSWLYHFRNTHPAETERHGTRTVLGNNKESLAFLQSKAKEGKMWSIYSSTLLNNAKYHLATGSTAREALELVYQASYTNCSYNVRSVIGAQLLVQSSIFARLGNAPISSSYCNLVKTCYKTHSPKEELLRSQCRDAYSAILKGNYENARQTMQSVPASTLRVLKLHQYWTICNDVMEMKGCLKRNELQLAENKIAKLKSAPLLDQELAFQIGLLEIEYLSQCDNLSAAFGVVEALNAQCEQYSADVYYRITLLVTKATLFAKGCSAEKGLSLAVRAVMSAYQTRAISLLCEACNALATVLIDLGYFAAARSILVAVIYQAMENDDTVLNARLQATLVDAEVGMAGTFTAVDPRRIDLLQSAVKWAKRAKDSMRSIQDDLGERAMAIKISLLHDVFAVA